MRTDLRNGPRKKNMRFTLVYHIRRANHLFRRGKRSQRTFLACAHPRRQAVTNLAG